MLTNIDGLFSKDVVSQLIGEGRRLLLSGEASLLRELPKGSWIGGSIPYFLTAQGGLKTQDKIFVRELPSFTQSVKVQVYDKKTLEGVYHDAPRSGFSFMILPGFSEVHSFFALRAPELSGFGTRPLLGWVSGFSLEGEATEALVFDGTTGSAFTNRAVVCHVELPVHKVVDINIVNLFEQGDGDVIVFPEDGFQITWAEINGERCRFSDYLLARRVDTKLPLVSDLQGASLNTSFKQVDASKGVVSLFAPVYQGFEYRLARPVGDYVAEFEKRVADIDGDELFFSCNCVLNYLYAGLEGRKTGLFRGPATFGEIAYQLLNQTLVYLTIS